MGFFDFFSKRIQAPSPMAPTVPQERLWVGKIMGLILGELRCGDWNKAELLDWSIIIDETNDPYILSGRPQPGESHRYCSLGDCPTFSKVQDFLNVPLALEMAVQSLAFEICRRAEPRWDEIVASDRNA